MTEPFYSKILSFQKEHDNLFLMNVWVGWKGKVLYLTNICFLFTQLFNFGYFYFLGIFDKHLDTQLRFMHFQ